MHWPMRVVAGKIIARRGSLRYIGVERRFLCTNTLSLGVRSRFGGDDGGGDDGSGVETTTAWLCCGAAGVPARQQQRCNHRNLEK